MGIGLGIEGENIAEKSFGQRDQGGSNQARDERGEREKVGGWKDTQPWCWGGAGRMVNKGTYIHGRFQAQPSLTNFHERLT